MLYSFLSIVTAALYRYQLFIFQPDQQVSGGKSSLLINDGRTVMLKKDQHHTPKYQCLQLKIVPTTKLALHFVSHMAKTIMFPACQNLAANKHCPQG